MKVFFLKVSEIKYRVAVVVLYTRDMSSAYLLYLDNCYK